MKTRILKPTEENLIIAGRAIAEGKLVAFPTETVYGLGADAFNEEAVKSVYAAKGRPSDNPMIVHIWNGEQLSELTISSNDDVAVLAKEFWPGPLTMILTKKPGIPDVTTGGLDTVGIRMPENRIARALIKASGCPIAAPSANISGRPSPTRAEHVIEDMDGRIDFIITGDDCRVGIESTVIDMTGDTPVILRPGIITAEQISKVLSKPVEIDPAVLRKSISDDDIIPRAPGMKYRHYAPKADMVIVQGEHEKVRDEINRIKQQKESEGLDVGIIMFEEDNFLYAAKELFAELRKMDEENKDFIIAGALPVEDGVGFAVMNRMLKSAGYNVVEV